MSKAGLPATQLVIFGITGDLSQRKLLPALAQLEKNGQLPPKFQIMGLSRRRVSARQVLGKRSACLAKYTRMLQMDMGLPADYQKLKDAIAKNHQTIFYFAVPPGAVLPVVKCLGDSGLNGSASKLMLEKPFGTDLSSARSLINQIKKYFDEGQVYRIDHYLAKEAAQNIAVFLGSNAVFREVWNNRFIDKIEIFASEEIGIEGRAELWETTGTLRDFVQSHILQLAALTLMVPCDNFADFERLPSLRLAALKKLKSQTGLCLRGQYRGYKKEVSNPDSFVETFAALELTSSDARWRGVPIVLATGKHLSEKLTEIRVQFKRIDGSRTNRLVMRIQPKEGIEFDLWVKQPGPVRQLQKLSLNFSYQQHFARLPDAYEQVLLDGLRSNHSLFASSEEVLVSWKILEPILTRWKKPDQDLLVYKPGTTLESLVERMGR